jgi:FKBP-type peptidyl-prolyl cis-trans isomerase (trigger factor)
VIDLLTLKMQFGLFALGVFAFLAFSNAAEDAKKDDEVKIEILTPPPEGCERKTKKFDNVKMNYRGTLTADGTEFDSSYDRDAPFEFQLGTGQVIKGWDEGLLDMCVGEKRKLIIPSSKGYGEQGAGGNIPPNAGLTFEVDLLEVTDGEKPPNVFKEIDSDGDMKLSQDEVSSYLKARASEMEPGQEHNEEQHKEIITQIFHHEDKDKDGFIAHEEFSGPKHDEL